MDSAMPKIKVASPSFSKNSLLKQNLQSQFSDVTFHDGPELVDEEALTTYLKDAQGVIIGKEPVTEAVLSQCPDLKVISKYGVGLDSIDQVACDARSIQVGWTPGVNKLSVAEMVLGFMLTLSKNMVQNSLALKSGNWVKNGGNQLSGKTIGIIGLGHTGREVVRLLAPFHCRLLANDIVDIGPFCKLNGVESVTKKTLWQQADIITIHTPLTDQTHALINDGVFQLLRPTAILINTARGPIIDANALEQALINGNLYAAALDVYDIEPAPASSLLSLSNVFCTPHIGGNTQEAVLAMGKHAIDHLTSFFK